MARVYGRIVPVRAIFKPRASRDGASVDCAQRISVSHNIGPQAQRFAGFLSKLYRPGGIESLYDSSYLDEWRDEQLSARAEVEERARLEMLNNLDV